LSKSVWGEKSEPEAKALEFFSRKYRGTENKN
jgi:hypothetical protein